MTLEEYLDFLEQYWAMFPMPASHPRPKKYNNILL